MLLSLQPVRGTLKHIALLSQVHYKDEANQYLLRKIRLRSKPSDAKQKRITIGPINYPPSLHPAKVGI